MVRTCLRQSEERFEAKMLSHKILIFPHLSNTKHLILPVNLPELEGGMFHFYIGVQHNVNLFL